jgi:polar amino acid transport system substrate-binding protein
MTIKSKAVLSTVVGTGVALALAACGGGSSSAKGDDLQTVQDGKFQCAMSGEYRPFNFYASDNELQGFDVEICRDIANQLGLEMSPVTGQFNTLIAGLKAHRFDAIVGSMSPTPERKKQVNFSAPYYQTGAQLFVAPDSTIGSVDSLHNATVGVALGTTFEEFANKQKGIKTVRTYKADIDALKDLEAGRLDAVITQDTMGRYLIKNAHLKVKPAGPVLFPDTAAIAVAKDRSALLKEINKALTKVKQDGTYKNSSMKWFGTDIAPKSK